MYKLIPKLRFVIPVLSLLISVCFCFFCCLVVVLCIADLECDQNYMTHFVESYFFLINIIVVPPEH